MPLLLDKNIGNYARLAVWDAQEGNAYFKRSLKMTAQEKDAYTKMKPHRQREWMISRFLLDYISEDKKRRPIMKTDFGKPYRVDCHKHISISHSKDKVAVILADRPVGIDIQNEVEKITRIQHKFISNTERKRLPDVNLVPYYHIFWGAKESMYKAYGNKELEFKEHMHVYPFKYFASKLELSGWVKKDTYAEDFEIYAEKLMDNYLVYCLKAS